MSTKRWLPRYQGLGVVVVAAGGIGTWLLLLTALLTAGLAERLLLLAFVEVVPVWLLVDCHLADDFRGSRKIRRRWAWVLAGSTWFPPLALAVAYHYRDETGARRRPRLVGLDTDPPVSP